MRREMKKTKNKKRTNRRDARTTCERRELPAPMRDKRPRTGPHAIGNEEYSARNSREKLRVKCSLVCLEYFRRESRRAPAPSVSQSVGPPARRSATPSTIHRREALLVFTRRTRPRRAAPRLPFISPVCLLRRNEADRCRTRGTEIAHKDDRNRRPDFISR